MARRATASITSAHPPAPTPTQTVEHRKQPVRKCSASKPQPKAVSAAPASSSTRRLRSEDTADQNPRPQSTAAAIDRTQAKIVTGFADSFWRAVIATSIESHEQAEGGAGQRLTASENQCWNPLSAVRDLLPGGPGLFVAHFETQDIYSRDTILKYNLATLFFTLLTTPSKLTSKSIKLFISELIVHHQFSVNTRKNAFLEFLVEFEIQNFYAALLDKTGRLTSFFHQNQAPHSIQDYVRYLTDDQDLEFQVEGWMTRAFKEQFEGEQVYKTLDSLRQNVETIDDVAPYSEFLECIKDLFRKEFPDLDGPPASTSRPSQISTSPRVGSLSEVYEDQKPNTDRLTIPRGEDDNENDQDVSDCRSRSASQSFLIDTLRPHGSEPQINDDVLVGSYTGPRAGSPEARHHQNVAGEVAANANLFIGFSKELAKSTNKISARLDHPASNISGNSEASKDRPKLFSGKFDFTRRQSDASQIPWTETPIDAPGGQSDHSRAESEAFTTARQKRETLSSDIQIVSGTHQNDPAESEESTERKPQEMTEDGESEVGPSLSSHAQNQQRSSPNKSIQLPVHQENSTGPKTSPRRCDQSAVLPGSLATKPAEHFAAFLGIENDPTCQNDCTTKEQAPVGSGKDRSDDIPGPPDQGPRSPERRNDLDRVEEEGTRTVRPQDRQGSVSASKQLESPVERHDRNLKEKNKEVEPQVSTHKQQKSKQTKVKLPNTGQRFLTDSESDESPDACEKENDRGTVVSVAGTSKDKGGVDGQGEGSGTTRAGPKRAREVEGGVTVSADLNNVEHELQEGGTKDGKPNKRIKTDKGGKARERTPSSERHEARDKVTQGNSKGKREDSTGGIDGSSPTNRGASLTVKKEARSKASPAAGRRRQAWTWEQEQLFIEEVIRFSEQKYNCFAYILQRHGTDGTESQVLANRTNVMLKDKAIQITTKWAREGKKISKKTRDAFARFPPKSGGVLLCFTPEEEQERLKKAEERKRSRSKRAESGLNVGQSTGVEREELVIEGSSRSSPAKSNRSMKSLSPVDEAVIPTPGNHLAVDTPLGFVDGIVTPEKQV